MARTPRLHRLDSDELLIVHQELKSIREKIGWIHTKIDQRFGISDKKAVRLEALLRKLSEVDRLFEDSAE
ncbi:MAG TPA: hypothetical protein VIF10_14380 [Methylobacter sp.]